MGEQPDRRPARDGRITEAREAITAASEVVMSGELSYTGEQVVERLTEVIEGLLTLLDEREESR
jgi:hypothetical protein